MVLTIAPLTVSTAALTISPVPRMVPMIPFLTDSAMFVRLSVITGLLCWLDRRLAVEVAPATVQQRCRPVLDVMPSPRFRELSGPRLAARIGGVDSSEINDEMRDEEQRRCDLGAARSLV